MRTTFNTSKDELVAYVSVRSIGGVSLFSGNAKLRSDNVGAFHSSPEDTHRAIGRLEEMGFSVDRRDELSVRVRAPARVFERKLGIKFERHEKVPMYVPTDATAANCLNMGAEFFEGVAFPQPLQLHGGSKHTKLLPRKSVRASAKKAVPRPKGASRPAATPPAVNYYHLDVPSGILKALNVGPVHAEGFKGQNVRAAMIDSGFHWSHPYFQGRGYNLQVSMPPGGDSDDVGHGTGESANLLAVAPKVKLFGLSMDDAVTAFQTCRQLGVQIVSNSWGSAVDTDGPMSSWAPYWSLVLAEIAQCAAAGILVLFSAGNGGVSATASSPDVISVGGVYRKDDGTLEATPYASSFDSFRFPGQHVPHVCGLCGLPPKAIYLALPIPPGCEIDRAFGGSAKFPNGDETSKNDGWGVFSGTSAACPMVAGVVALILSKHHGAKLADVKARLALAQDVVQGQSAQGQPAALGFDAATGFGLVDAEKACA